MKKILTGIILLLALVHTTNAQTLYGTTANGGANAGGTINKFITTTNNLIVSQSFEKLGSSTPYGNLIQANDGKLYGMTSGGGAYNAGRIFSYDPSSGACSFLKDFDNTKGDTPLGSTPLGSLLQASDGKLYGMTSTGGIFRGSYGVIFSYDPSTAIYSNLFNLNGSLGANPNGSFIQASDGKLYGVTSSGGSYSSGVIFSCDLRNGDIYTKLFDFDTTNGSTPYGSLMQAGDGKLYGMTSAGGSNNLGVIFSFDPLNRIYTKLFDFDNTNGSTPYGSLMQAGDGKLYGMTSAGGSNNLGVIFSYDPSSGIYSDLKDLVDSTAGINPHGSFIQASDGKLYGMTPTGGSNNTGVIFSYDPSGAAYNKLKDFDSTSGGYPYGSLLQTSDGKLYGMTSADGGLLNSTGSGVIFSYDLPGSTYSKLKVFGGDGNAPLGSLVEASDGKLYGMTSAGGSNNLGVIFSYDSSSGIYTNLMDFDYTHGASPYGNLIQASDGKFYGMTPYGGSNGAGVIFSYDPLNVIYNKLLDFDGTNGAYPYGGLVQVSDGKLYGMTSGGGSYSSGVIFSYDPLNGIYNKLLDFDSTNGAYAYGGLVQASDGKLYGTTGAGGSNNTGVIFSYDPSGAAYNKLKDFDYTSGIYPYGSLIQASDGTLYGMTTAGGSQGYGTIFSFNISGGIYTKLKDFANTDGAYPFGSLMQASDGRLYGMTNSGGGSGEGVIFSFNPSSATYTKLQDYTVDNGANPLYTSFIELTNKAGITTSPVNATSYCQGAALKVPYVIRGIYNSGNVFTAQLSDANGNFANPTNIGAVTTTTNDTISATIPAGAAAGTAYRIRVVSSNPVITGSDNGTDLTINTVVIPTIVISTDTTTVCANNNTSFTAAITNGGSAPVYQWKINGVDTGSSNNVFSSLLKNGDHILCNLTSNATCAIPPTAASNSIAMTVNPLNTYYRDADGDGYGNRKDSIRACTKPAGYVTNNKDCDDTNPSVHSGCSLLPPAISIEGRSFKEGNRNEKNVSFNVKLNKKSTNTITVNYATQNGTATAGVDYIATNGTATFIPGITKTQISVLIIGDKTVEPNETFYIKLSNPVNATIADSIATATILNDDGTAGILSTGKDDDAQASAITNTVTIAPNPASSTVNISLSNYTGNVTIQLSDMEGKRLREKKVQASMAKLNQTTLDVSHYANGVYFITVFDDKGNVQTEKLVITR